MRLPFLLILTLTLCATGCPPAEQPTVAQDETPAADADAPAADAPAADAPAADAPAADAPASSGEATTAVYDVECGCTIEAIGHCGEYAIVGGEPMEITGDLGLGSMPFCGKSDLRAEIDGSIQDGKLVATQLTIVE